MLSADNLTQYAKFPPERDSVYRGNQSYDFNSGHPKNNVCLLSLDKLTENANYQENMAVSPQFRELFL